MISIQAVKKIMWPSCKIKTVKKIVKPNVEVKK